MGVPLSVEDEYLVQSDGFPQTLDVAVTVDNISFP